VTRKVPLFIMRYGFFLNRIDARREVSQSHRCVVGCFESEGVSPMCEKEVELLKETVP
jgi:hypothetical protein